MTDAYCAKVIMEFVGIVNVASEVSGRSHYEDQCGSYPKGTVTELTIRLIESQLQKIVKESNLQIRILLYSLQECSRIRSKRTKDAVGNLCGVYVEIATIISNIPYMEVFFLLLFFLLFSRRWGFDIDMFVDCVLWKKKGNLGQ